MRKPASAIDHLLRKTAFSGSVFVAHKGREVLSQGYGLANIELSVPATSRTKYRIGSLTKLITATAVLQLTETEDLQLDHSISCYIKDFPNGEKITIRHLLTHTSGIPNLTDFPDFRKWLQTEPTPEEVIGRFKDRPLDFQPGDKSRYSNSGYILLSHLIKERSGNSYEAFITKSILHPSGMYNTGMDRHDAIIENRASGYQYDNGTLINAPYMNMAIPQGAAALLSTTEDLYRFDQALSDGSLLSEESLQMMHTRSRGDYGLGWMIKEDRGQRVAFHGGSINGFSAMFVRYFDSATTVILLSNKLGEKKEKERLTADIIDCLFGRSGL